MSNSSKNNNKPSTYKVDVLANYRSYKDAVRSTGKGLRMLKVALKDDPQAKPMLRQIEKVLADKELYEKLNANVRRIKKGDNKGKTCPFYIMQAVYKMKEGKLGESKKPSTSNSNKPVNKTTGKNLTKIQDKTVKELKELAKNKKVKNYSKMKKDELIVALKAA